MNCQQRVRCSKYYFLFVISCKILCKYFFNVFFDFFMNLQKYKLKSFESPKSKRNYEKNSAWNIRPLVNESFNPVTQRIILKIVRLLDSGLYCGQTQKTEIILLSSCPQFTLKSFLYVVFRLSNR